MRLSDLQTRPASEVLCRSERPASSCSTHLAKISRDRATKPAANSTPRRAAFYAPNTRSNAARILAR